MTLRTLLRSNPVRRAMAETPAPCHKSPGTAGQRIPGGAAERGGITRDGIVSVNGNLYNVPNFSGWSDSANSSRLALLGSFHPALTWATAV